MYPFSHYEKNIRNTTIKHLPRPRCLNVSDAKKYIAIQNKRYRLGIKYWANETLAQAVDRFEGHPKVTKERAGEYSRAGECYMNMPHMRICLARRV